MEAEPAGIISEAFDAESFREQGHQIVDLLTDALSAAKQGIPHVRSNQTPTKSFEFWQDYLESDFSTQALITRVVESSFRCHHPHNLGHQVGPVLPAAALTELACSLLDIGNGVFEVGNPATPMERVVIKELAARIGFPVTADGILTSGGSLGNLTALLAMRQKQVGNWDSGSHGKFTILVSEEAHYCMERSVKIMGWGDAGLTRVNVDSEFRLCPSDLRKTYQEAIDNGMKVLGVVACAGSTATGRIDPLDEIADFCKSNDLWLHVDAAHAGAFIFSEKAGKLMAGLHQADSVVIDFHKMLLSPSLLTAVIFKKADDSYQSFAQKADYLWQNNATHEWWDAAKRTLECTRPMLGLRAYAVIQAGRKGLFEAYIDRCLENSTHFADMIKQAVDFQLLTEPESNIVCYRYLTDLDDKSLNSLNAEIRQRIIASGEFYLVQVEKSGITYLRSALMNPFINHGVIESLVDRIRTEAANILEER